MYRRLSPIFTIVKTLNIKYASIVYSLNYRLEHPLENAVYYSIISLILDEMFDYSIIYCKQIKCYFLFEKDSEFMLTSNKNHPKCQNTGSKRTTWFIKMYLKHI